MAKEEYILDGYLFSSRSEFDRAKKEKETITYLTANTDQTDRKAMLRIYNRSVEKESFQTVIGWQYLHELRRQLVESRIVSEDTLAPIKAPSLAQNASAVGSERDAQAKKQVERYKNAYENAVANRRISNMVIGVLIAVIIGMVILTATTKYSVFTYFTDYKTKMRNEVIDELNDWEKQLEQRESELKKQEQE